MPRGDKSAYTASRNGRLSTSRKATSTAACRRAKQSAARGRRSTRKLAAARRAAVDVARQLTVLLHVRAGGKLGGQSSRFASGKGAIRFSKKGSGHAQKHGRGLTDCPLTLWPS